MYPTFNNLRECSLLVVHDVVVSVLPHDPTCKEWWCSSCKMLKLVETPFLFETCWLRNPQLQTMDRNFRDYPLQTNIARGNPRKTMLFNLLNDTFKPFIACWINVRLLYQTFCPIIPRLRVWYGKLSIHTNSFQNVLQKITTMNHIDIQAPCALTATNTKSICHPFHAEHRVSGFVHSSAISPTLLLSFKHDFQKVCWFVIPNFGHKAGHFVG